MTKTSWEVLSAIDVSSKIEKKNGMSYLSWAWAWGVLKGLYPNAVFIKHHRPDGMPYFMDMMGYAYVRVTVRLNSEDSAEVTETFPILDHRNRPIQNPSSFDVNNALQRCLTKAIGYLGLGHYIYAGEDLPQDFTGGPVEANDPKGAPTPPASQTSPSTAPAVGTSEVPLVDLDGNITGHSSETVGAVFTQFIPLCRTEPELNRMYTANRTAIAYLQATNVDLHKEVMAKFAERKAQIKASQKEGEN